MGRKNLQEAPSKQRPSTRDGPPAASAAPKAHPMWPPILHRGGGGGGGVGQSGYNYNDMEKWLPGRVSDANLQGAKKGAVRRKAATNHEPEVFEYEGERILVEYYVYERTGKDRLKIVFFKGKLTSFLYLLLMFLLKLTTCILYCVRVYYDHPQFARCYKCENQPYIDHKFDADNFEGIRWLALIWVERPLWMWATQVTIAILTLSLTLLTSYLRYKGNFYTILTWRLFMEIFCTVPFIITIGWEPLVHLFIPVFLNIWIIKYFLEAMCNHSKYGMANSLLAQQVVTVLMTIICLIFTAICGFQHLQRAGKNTVNMFESFYFIMVTLSTVGYGDLTPDIWISQILVVMVIFTALGILPKQFDMLATTLGERKRLGGSYTKSKRAGAEKHVILCLPALSPDTLMDFLSEFYAYRRLQDHTVVLLTNDDLQPVTRQIMQRNTWANKVKYIKGSCLRDSDLMRVRITDADGIFILGVDSGDEKHIADERTILNSWAVKDFAPKTPQYIQIFRPENKVYIDFANSVVCEDEFKYAMLAYNCICPGTSTLITLLLHTSRGLEGSQCDEDWIRLYGKCSGNEIYTIKASESIVFKQYLGKTFPYASMQGHKRYGLLLMAVKRRDDPDDEVVRLNPGHKHILRETDQCYYLSITREQNLNFTKTKITPAGIPLSALGKRKVAPSEKNVLAGQSQPPTSAAKYVTANEESHPDDKNPSEIVVNATTTNGISKDVAKMIQNTGKMAMIQEPLEELDENDAFESDDTWIKNIERSSLKVGYPEVTAYVGTHPSSCYLLKKKKPACCMRLDLECDHNNNQNAKQYGWRERPVIMAISNPDKGLYNFILPIRRKVLNKGTLKPVIFVFENEPDDAFVDAISWFPLVYWMKGSIENLDDLLRAGIDFADSLVVANREGQGEDDEMSDCATIVTVQKLYKFFPTMKITTELTSTTMMRFLHFQAGNAYAQYLSLVEKQEREKGSHVSFMFRPQFASGNVFSASMIHTLLYQAILKDFVITCTRLLLGIDDTPGSGFLTGVYVKESDLIERDTFGKMFAHLCAKNGVIPIAIYRQQSTGNERFTVNVTDPQLARIAKLEECEIAGLIRSRMEALGMRPEDYGSSHKEKHRIGKSGEYVDESGALFKFVVVNPHVDLPLQVGDFLYLLKPTNYEGNVKPDVQTQSGQEEN